MADRVKDACEANFAAHSSDCSGFAKAVAQQLGITLNGLAMTLSIRSAAGRHGPFWPTASPRRRQRPMGSSSSAACAATSRPIPTRTVMSSWSSPRSLGRSWRMANIPLRIGAGSAVSATRTRPSIGPGTNRTATTSPTLPTTYRPHKDRRR